MQSAKLTLLTVTALLAMSSAGCNTLPTATGCSELARDVLTTDTEHAKLGNSGDPALDWQLYGTAETVQLNTANDRSQTGFRIINGCEVRDAELRREMAKPWFLRLFG